MGSLGSTLDRLQCSHLDTWGNKEQEPCLHYSHKYQECVPYHDCMPFSSMIHCHQLQLAVRAAVAAMVAVVARAAGVVEDVVAAVAIKVTRDVTMEFKGFMEIMGHHKSLEISLLTLVIVKAVMEGPMFKDFSREVIVAEMDAAVAIVIAEDVVTRAAAVVGYAAVMAAAVIVEGVATMAIATEVTTIVAMAVAVKDAIAMATTVEVTIAIVEVVTTSVEAAKVTTGAAVAIVAA